MGTLDGKVALVTGASRGIGAATARAFAEEGARVVLIHRDSADAANAVAAGLAGSGHRVVQADVVDSQALRGAAESVTQEEGRLDVLVNNAAWTRVIPHTDMDALDDETFDRILATNVRGPFAVVRAFRSLLEADGGGVVVNVTSLAATMAQGSNVAYCASKAALNNVTLTLARVLAPDVRVIAVAPGLVDTELTASWPAERRQTMIDLTPLGRLATPEEVGRTILGAATHLEFSTGIVIPVDGGRPLGGERP